jgi:hypothetical protein
MGGNVVDWLAWFDQEDVRSVILDRRGDRDLVEMLRCRHGWMIDFEDKESVIFMRRSR